MHSHDAQVSVVVIGYDDATHVTDAVRSALAQGGVVHEVIAVDDCSTDGSAELLDALAAEDPRVTVVRRTVNSGGCGTPRNDGIDAATAPYLMFLDSDDVLPPGAVETLLRAAVAHGTQLAAGLCVRRELPSGREVPWQPELYERSAVVSHPSRRPRLVHDTLCVNKLYRTDFLREHGIRFPEGRFPYEDFVFSARVLAAGPSIALVPDTVYVWHVRRSAQRLSISLDRADTANWKARMKANRQAYETLLGVGEKRLARAARCTFLDRGLRMYARELPLREAEYRDAWWKLTRAYLSGFDTADFAQASVPGRVIAQVVLAAEQPRDLHRLRELAARPARLTPPYASTGDGIPVWSADLPQVQLEHLLHRPMRHLPVAVDAELRPRLRTTRLRLRLHELYGRVENARPARVDVEFVLREDSTRVGLTRTAALGRDAAGDGWTAEAPVDLQSLGAGTWDLRLMLRFDDGTSRDTTAHALTGPGLLRRRAVPSLRHGALLVQPYATHSGALALRVASGARGVTSVVGRRLRRLLHLR
ncbi:glycosyltransferase family 2 protein [Streptomyces colonosanans]|uniref:Transferase n=1 Tax=Streptomyces colonosanans TaxID=1428652 RepID=A0A1S2P0F8_9ACTN|nr:glycosyltransferase family 2 protein [Streptomyces colonosanans]OIJ86982.1 transferase [Streptomyces colonosanans]